MWTKLLFYNGSITNAYLNNCSLLNTKVWNLSCISASFDCASITNCSFHNLSSITGSFGTFIQQMCPYCMINAGI